MYHPIFSTPHIIPNLCHHIQSSAFIFKFCNMVLQHRNWRASFPMGDRDEYKVAKLYLEYWRTTDSARLHFDLSWFSTDPELRTNCPRRAFIVRFYNIEIGEPPVWLLILTTTKSLSFISNIDGPVTVSIFIWVDFRWITSKEQIVDGAPSSFGSTTKKLESLQFGCWTWRLRSR